MIKITTQTKAQPVTKINAALSGELKSILADVSQQLRSIAARLGSQIEDQVTDPDVVPEQGVAADRLLDWTADIFALAEDIDFYTNPAPTDESE